MECLFTCHCPESGQLSGLSCLRWRAYTHTLEISGSDFLDRCAVSVIFPVYSSIYTAVHTAVYLPHDILHDFLYDWS